MSFHPLIVAALKDEVRIFVSKMRVDCTIHFKPAIFWRGHFNQKPVAVLATGIGSDGARKGLELAFAQGVPSSILFVGYAGAASPLAKVGDLVLAKAVVSAQLEEGIAASAELLKKGEGVCRAKSLSHHAGGFVTPDHVVANPHEKADLGAVHKALALDMEAFAVARFAKEKGVPCLVAKAILDSVEMALPDLADCVTAIGEPRPMALVEHLCKTPGDLALLPQIQFNAVQAKATITSFLEGWMEI